MIKELLSSKLVQLSGRSWLQKQGSKHFIGHGVLMANGSNWYHQRHTVAPAFMGDALKVYVGLNFSFSSNKIIMVKEKKEWLRK